VYPGRKAIMGKYLEKQVTYLRRQTIVKIQSVNMKKKKKDNQKKKKIM
jgi:hypothetical protein